MNQGEHLFGAMLFSVALLYRFKTQGLILTSDLSIVLILLALGASLLPDKIEPPTDANHRKIWHSVLALSLALVVLWKLYGSLVITKSVPELVGFFIILGYSLHLVLDATTRGGLPWV
ncbi:MAG: metal-dependent hydrolase [Euryarchaeota archaeon]|nr:metal-dependent hydrolase [Euryarchaeota archaeon]